MICTNWLNFLLRLNGRIKTPQPEHRIWRTTKRKELNPIQIRSDLHPLFESPNR